MEVFCLSDDQTNGIAARSGIRRVKFIMKRLPYLLTVLACSVVSSLAGKVIQKSVTGTPSIGRIDVLSFAPGGVLLIGDGSKQQIIAVETGSSGRKDDSMADIKGFTGKIAGRLGVSAKDVEIIDLVVNPDSGKLFVAVRKQDDKSYLILRVAADGSIGHFQLKDVRHARVPLPNGDKALVSKITDLAWAGNRLVASARCSEVFASKIFATDGALVHNQTGQLFSAETYHVAHRKWETKAPMSVLIPYEEDDKHYIVGAFSCTPVVKYPIDDLKPGAKIKGISMIELGSGNRPLDMFAYKQGAKASVLANTFRFHHAKRPFGPSPYWAVRFDQNVLAANDKVNEKATRRPTGKQAALDTMEMVDAFHGVVQMDRLNDQTAIALRVAAGKEFDLVKISLP
jgi:hypothetical protein